MEDKGKKPQRKENAFREWVSDNLRYILLILGIAVIIAAVILGIRLISGWSGGQNREPQAVSQAKTPEPTQEPEEETVTPTPEKTETPTPTPEETAEPTPEETETPAPTPEAAETPKPSPAETEPEETGSPEQEIQNLLTAYYQALSDKNPDGLSGLVDSLTAEDRQAVAENQVIASYSGVRTYVYAGADENSYVVLASYNYRYSGYDQSLPALTQFYVYGDGSGNYWLASDVPDSAAAARVQEVLGMPEVQQLISDTRAAYESVLDSDSSLKAYAESLS